VIHFDGPAPQQSKDFEAIPTGDVSEGNEESDWAAWEDSVSFQDSMMPGYQGSVTLSQSMQEASNALPAPPSEGMLAVEVIEGDDESAWAAWEESVHFQESQLQTVQGSATASGSSPGEVSTEHVDIF